jgi:hypothetical protein
VSQKLANPITVLNWLNKLHKDERQELDIERDLKCWTCGKALTPNEIIIPQTGGSNAGRKKRHPECAYRIGLISKTDLEKLRTMKNLVFVSLMAGWIAVMAQYSVLVNG